MKSLIVTITILAWVGMIAGKEGFESVDLRMVEIPDALLREMGQAGMLDRFIPKDE